MIDHDELGNETIEKYLELRKAKKLGPIWLSGTNRGVLRC